MRDMHPVEGLVINTRVARRTIIALATAMALPLCAAQAQPRGGFGGGPGFSGPGFGGRGPGFGGGWGGGWHGGWGWPFLGGALLGLGLGLFPYYAAPPPAYYPPPYYPPPANYPPSGYYPYAYGYYPNAYAPGHYGYASPPTPYPPQAYGYRTPAGLNPNNCGTPEDPKLCSLR